MPYKLKSEIQWYQDGELASATFTSTEPDGVSNRPLEDLFDNIQFVKDDLDNNYYNKTEVDSLISSAIGGVPTVHTDLTGLQGGTTGEFFHLTSSEHVDLTGTTQAAQNASISALDTRVTSLESGAGATPTGEVIFFNSGVWGKPDGVTLLFVTIVGGGAGGGSGGLTANSGFGSPGGETTITISGDTRRASGGSTLTETLRVESAGYLGTPPDNMTELPGGFLSAGNGGDFLGRGVGGAANGSPPGYGGGGGGVGGGTLGLTYGPGVDGGGPGNGGLGGVGAVDGLGRQGIGGAGGIGGGSGSVGASPQFPSGGGGGGYGAGGGPSQIGYSPGNVGEYGWGKAGEVASFVVSVSSSPLSISFVVGGGGDGQGPNNSNGGSGGGGGGVVIIAY